MVPISCLKIIHDSFSSMSYSEKLIAKYTLDNSASVVTLSIKELAETLGIAPSTIIYFVKKLGYSGYKDFKINLASEIGNSSAQNWMSSVMHQDHNTQESPYSIISSLNSQLLLDSCNFLNPFKINEAVEAILNAKRVVLFGIGTSGLLVQEAYDMLFRLGIDCYFNTDIHYQLLAASLMKKDEVALIISQSGINKTVLEITENILTKNVTTIGICNYAKTPFSKMVDISLALFPSYELKHPKHFVFKIPILCVLETIYHMLSVQMGELSEDAIMQTRNIVINNSVHF